MLDLGGGGQMSVVDGKVHAFNGAVRFRDVDDLNEGSAALGIRFEQLGRGRLDSVYALASVGGMHLSAASYSTGATCRGAAGPGFCMIGVPRRGPANHRSNGVIEDADCSIVRPGQEFLISSAGRFDVLALVVDLGALESAVQSRWGRSLDVHASGYRLHLDGPGARAMLHGRILGLLATAVGNSRDVGRAVPAETLEEVLDALAGLMRSPDGLPSDPGRCRIARRAEALIRERIAVECSIRSLAEELRTTIRTIELGFQEVFGTTPRAYQRALRLNAARRDLLARRGADSVTAVALRWNLTHLGRFSVDYRRMFGEMPSATLRRRAA
jgi:AraC family ethanolamine operon transcriptional activator